MFSFFAEKLDHELGNGANIRCYQDRKISHFMQEGLSCVYHRI